VQNLTDGIFAVAMTLLVLDIRLGAGVGSRQLGEALFELIPRVYSYVISFFVLALFWWGYHRVVALFSHADDGFVWLNIMFLFAVTFAPFTAHVLGAFYGKRLPTELYCFHLTVLSALLSLLWSCGERHKLVDLQVDALRRRVVTLRLRGTIVAYASTMVIGFWFPYWFWLGFATIIPARLISRRLAHA
jgi:uncharacterized membrane protein